MRAQIALFNNAARYDEQRHSQQHIVAGLSVAIRYQEVRRIATGNDQEKCRAEVSGRHRDADHQKDQQKNNGNYHRGIHTLSPSFSAPLRLL